MQISLDDFPDASATRSPARFLTAPVIAAISTSLKLGAREVGGWSSAEHEIAAACADEIPIGGLELGQHLLRGDDPLGDVYSAALPVERRRRQGCTLTPAHLVTQMVEMAASMANPSQVIDPGTGSGRFLLGAGARFPNAELVGVESDPCLAIIARGNLAARGWAGRSHVVCDDFRTTPIPQAAGTRLFIGNPPYTRHHDIAASGKEWLAEQSSRLGVRFSLLAGLHVHFLVATALRGQAGDTAVFVTASEWLDVNYGRPLRELCLGQLGCRRVLLVDPREAAFEDAMTTAAISVFRLGSPPDSLEFCRIADSRHLDAPDVRRILPVADVQSADRWSEYTTELPEPEGNLIELGDLCRVHRGQVTGMNEFWIAGPHSLGLPDEVLAPCVTRARELIEAGPVLVSGAGLRRVVNLPGELDGISKADRAAVERFLSQGIRLGADKSYIARHRTPWWSVGLREPAPILATYMARRAPAFVRNVAGARAINIAHGIYPRQPLSALALDRLARYLHQNAGTRGGRSYAGGLTKFEPREMERIRVPPLAALEGRDE